MGFVGDEIRSSSWNSRWNGPNFSRCLPSDILRSRNDGLHADRNNFRKYVLLQLGEKVPLHASSIQTNTSEKRLPHHKYRLSSHQAASYPYLFLWKSSSHILNQQAWIDSCNWGEAFRVCMFPEKVYWRSYDHWFLKKRLLWSLQRRGQWQLICLNKQNMCSNKLHPILRTVHFHRPRLIAQSGWKINLPVYIEWQVSIILRKQINR